MLGLGLTGYDWLLIGWGIFWEALITAGMLLIHRAITAESSRLAQSEGSALAKPAKAENSHLAKGGMSAQTWPNLPSCQSQKFVAAEERDRLVLWEGAMEATTLRAIEIRCGQIAAVLGIFVPAYGLLFVTPPLSEPGSILIIIFSLALAVGVGAMIDSHSTSVQDISLGLALLWSATVPLIGLTFVPFGNLGIYILPTAILALASALAGSYADR